MYAWRIVERIESLKIVSSSQFNQGKDSGSRADHARGDTDDCGSVGNYNILGSLNS